ncbi:MFS transporter [Actinopolymorpha sp. B11F2]|uniref:MFS transporter n=1 Tax=Actinopolymorpha sp. B11F2 TaxID=3160862 RepID=UPI0032E4B278
MRQDRSMLFLTIGHGCVDVYQGALAALVPLFVAERAYSYAAVSGFVLATSLLSSLTQPLFGFVADRYPLRWLLPVSTLVAGVGIALSGVVGDYLVTVLLVALSGVGVAAYHPESARVARLVSRGSHRAMGWFVLGGNVGFAAAPLLVGLVAALGGLRYTPILLVPAVVGSVLYLLAAPAAPEPGPTTSRQVAGIDDWPAMVRLAAVVVCRSIVFVGLGTFLALHVAQRTGGGTAAGIAALAVLYVGGAVGTVAGGRLAERWHRVDVARWAYAVAVVGVSGIVVVPGLAIYPFVIVTAIALYVPFSLQTTLAQDYLPSRIGTASGITLGLTVSAGGLTSPLVGVLADHTSLQAALVPLVAMPALAWLLLRRLSEPTDAVGLTPGRRSMQSPGSPPGSG